MNTPAKSWQAVDAIVVRAACEAIEYGLMEAGAQGTETNESGANATVTGYFNASPQIEIIRSQLIDALRIYDLGAASLIDLSTREVPDRDWLAEWKKDWQPVEVGRFIVAPPWSDVTVRGTVASGSAKDRIVIRIEPGMAFGTGTHETTRLCLKAIEKYFRGRSFLDVGTGTGILAIAAAKMSPDARVEAFDSDADAVEIARENARLNGVGGLIDFRIGSVTEQTSSADLVCANLTAPVIVELLPALLGASCGRLVLSGILAEQSEQVKSRLWELGAEGFETEQDGEWVALVV
ncbi:MAG: ribosomal protein methyltransferase [Blastocatellia bacterium]|nr:ribosomal protein methyltransferase [Blastocatellia bacterium]